MGRRALESQYRDDGGDRSRVSVRATFKAGVYCTGTPLDMQAAGLAELIVRITAD